MKYLPHIFCLQGKTWLIAASALADFLTGMAYFAIPAIILWQDYHQKLTIDRYLKPIWMILAVFIFSCGMGHWIDLANLWLAHYELKAFIGWCTACASIAAIWEFVKHGRRVHRILRFRYELLEAFDRIEAKWPTAG